MAMWVKLAWPGPRIAALHMLEPAATRGLPSTSTSVSTLPMPFLQGDREPVRGERRGGRFGGAARVVRIGPDHGEIGAQAARRFGHGPDTYFDLALDAVDAQPAGVDGGDVLRPGVDDGDLVTRAREQADEHRTHGTRADRRSSCVVLRRED
jgi:hypothetical protein